MKESLKKSRKQSQDELVLIQVKVSAHLKAEITAVAKKEKRSLSSQAAIFLEEGLLNPSAKNTLAARSAFI